MQKKILFTLIVLSTLISYSCKPKVSGSDIQSEADIEASKNETAKTVSPRVFDKAIPDACTLLSKSFISKTMNIPADAINIKDGSSRQSLKARSCFFKWDGDVPNGGLLVQVMKNPVEDEFADWVTEFVSNKKKQGEKSFTQEGLTYKYLDWNEVGDEGAYSADAAKYIWRIGNEFVFMLAFNLDIGIEEQNLAASVLSKEVMKNFK